MATNFPGSLDAFTNPTSGDTLDNPPHDQQHADVNDAVEALQAKVGVDGSAVTSSLDYKVNVALPAGNIGGNQTTTDVTFGGALATIFSSTFTLNTDRKVFVNAWVGELDSFSTSPMNIYMFVVDNATSDQIITNVTYYDGYGALSMHATRYLVLSAGTYTFNFQLGTNTGTCRADNASSVNRTSGFGVFDMGPA